MASFVSSNWAFSSAGVTLRKRRNHLKSEIVDALKCMKAIHINSLLLREVKTASDAAKELDAQEVVDGDRSMQATLDETDELSGGSSANTDDDD